MAGAVGLGHLAQGGGAATGAGAADGLEAEEFDGASDEFAVEAAGDEDGDVEIAEAVGGDQERAVPEGEDGGAGDLVAGG